MPVENDNLYLYEGKERQLERFQLPLLTDVDLRKHKRRLRNDEYRKKIRSLKVNAWKKLIPRRETFFPFVSVDIRGFWDQGTQGQKFIFLLMFEAIHALFWGLLL